MENRRKSRVGFVIGHKMGKTAVVSVKRTALEPTFKKYIKKAKSYKVHDERDEAKVGDQVQIVEARPVSKVKRWRLQKVLVKGAAPGFKVA